MSEREAEPVQAELVDEYEDETILQAQAIEWVVKNAEEGCCPVCDARMGVGKFETDPKYLREHLQKRHPTWCVRAEAQRTLNPIIKDHKPLAEQDFFEMGGIQRVEELDRFDALYVDQDIRDAARRKNATLRWAAPNKVRRYIDQGAVLVRNQGTPGVRQGSTEDSTVRTNEMVLIEIPEALANRRRKQKEARIERQLYARKEDIERAQDSTEKAIYDAMLQRGIDRTTAGQVAHAIAFGENKRQANWRGGDPRAHQGMVITDHQGKREI